jgi:hypothetical protein
LSRPVFLVKGKMMSLDKPKSTPAEDSARKIGQSRRASWLSQHVQDFCVGLEAHGYSFSIEGDATVKPGRVTFTDLAAQGRFVSSRSGALPPCDICAFLSDWCVATGSAKDVTSPRELQAALALYLARTNARPMKATVTARRLSEVLKNYVDPQTGKRVSKEKASRIQYVGLRLVPDLSISVGVQS